MSLHPQEIPPVPADTVRVAKAAFPRGNPYILLRNEVGSVYEDVTFASLFPKRGQPAEAPWRLAMVCIMQFAGGLSDRQAAEAVRSRIDWKYTLSLGLTDSAFDSTVWSEFRTRLVSGSRSAKTRSQHILTVTAISLVRLSDWLQGKPLSKTRQSSFTRLMAGATTSSEFASSSISKESPVA
jgi:transposase